MFVRWKRRPLIGDVYREDVCCPHTEGERETWTPVVVEVRRVAGLGPRQNVLWRPARSIHSCCALDPKDPIARVLWWSDVRRRVLAFLQRDDSNPSFDLVERDLTQILDTIAARVPRPTRDDSAVMRAWNEIPERVFRDAIGTSSRESHARRLWWARQRGIRRVVINELLQQTLDLPVNGPSDRGWEDPRGVRTTP